ncbi:MAG: hypothetical protein WCG16_05985 [Methylococcales bacterium]
MDSYSAFIWKDYQNRSDLSTTLEFIRLIAHDKPSITEKIKALQ